MSSKSKITRNPFAVALTQASPLHDNHDSWLIATHQGVLTLAVADGVSSHREAKQASLAAVRVLGDTRKRTPPRVHQRFAEANAMVYALGGTQGPKTTLVAALLREKTAHFYNIGDSQAYVWSPKTGIARVFPHNPYHFLCEYLGKEFCDGVQHIAADVCPGDVVLVASDGLDQETPLAEIGEAIGANIHRGRGATLKALLRLARQHGSVDDVTMVLAVVPPSGVVFG